MNLFKTCLGFLVFILPVLANAQGSQTGGGDQCKNEINQHRLQLISWILADEAKDLDFSQARVKGWTYENSAKASGYKNRMLEVMAEGKVVVSCYLDPARIQDPEARKITELEGISYKSITIGSPATPTTCVNYEDPSGISHIDCNYDLIMNQKAAGDPNYILTHHEFASIAGVEERTNSFTSDFSVSNQLAQFEHFKLLKVLGAKKVSRGYECQIQVSKDGVALGVMKWTQPDASTRYISDPLSNEEFSSVAVDRRSRIRMIGRVENQNQKSDEGSANRCNAYLDIQVGKQRYASDTYRHSAFIINFHGRGNFEVDHMGDGYHLKGGCTYR